MNSVMSDVKTILGNKLHKAVKESPTADAIATMLAARQRIRGFTDVKRLSMDLSREGFEINDKDVDKFFKLFENEGYGAMKGNRFLWKYNPRLVATAAIKGHDALATELPANQQREHDASRKAKHLSLVKESIQAKEEVHAIPLAEASKVPEVLEINGETYIHMNKEEYKKLQDIKKLISNIK